MAKETLEQRRARDAWEKSAKYKKEHADIAKGLPALIMNSGLMQAMAFMHDKGRAREEIAADLRQWLCEQCGVPRCFKDHMECLFKKNSQEFQQITLEALAWLKWLKLMASARQQEK